jgi:NAD(P) transhydrogenase subunit alpha
MIVGILKEPSFETRVSLLPEAVAQLTKKGISVLVERGAGEKASALDADFEKQEQRSAPYRKWHLPM